MQSPVLQKLLKVFWKKIIWKVWGLKKGAIFIPYTKPKGGGTSSTFWVAKILENETKKYGGDMRGGQEWEKWGAEKLSRDEEEEGKGHQESRNWKQLANSPGQSEG